MTTQPHNIVDAEMVESASGRSIDQQLLAAVHDSLKLLEELSRHRDRLGDEPTRTVQALIAESQRRLQRSELFVCVVGEKKAGKSTFLNALLGEALLSSAVRECTGTVTFIRPAREIGYRVVRAGGKEETFQSRYHDRTPEIVRAIEAARQACAKAVTDVDDLPRMIAETEQAIVVDQHRIVHEEQRLAQHQRALAQLEQQLELQQNEAATFRAELDAAGKALPFYVRNLADWRRPWNWPLQKMLVDPAGQAHIVQLERAREQQLAIEAQQKLIVSAQETIRLSQTSLDRYRQTLDEHQQRLIDLSLQLDYLPEHTIACGARLQALELELSQQGEVREQTFREHIRLLTDQDREGKDVEQLWLDFPSPRLPPGLVVIDTPGVNTNVEANARRAWQVIRGEADGAIVLSDLQQPVSGSTRDFVRALSGVMPHLMLVLTKVDRAMENAEILGESGEEQIEEARRMGEKRFAAEVGRDHRQLHSFTMAAERALRGDHPEWQQKFERDLALMMQILSHERPMIVAARAVVAIRQFTEQIRAASAAAEQAYRTTIAALEAQQIPDPVIYCETEVGKILPQIKRLSTVLASNGTSHLELKLSEVKSRIRQEITDCANSNQLRELLTNLQSRVERDLSYLSTSLQQELQSQAEGELRRIQNQLFAGLRERYRIVGEKFHLQVGEIASTTDVRTDVDMSDLAGSLAEKVQSIASSNMGGILGGAAVGAGVGSIIPGVGTVIGGLVGGVLGWMSGKSFSAVKEECASEVDTLFESVMESPIATMKQSAPSLAQNMCLAIQENLRVQVRHYRQWIAGVMEQERRRLQNERDQLAHLEALQQRLERQDQRLDHLMQLAASQSLGIVQRNRSE